jgi:hypothetical protein
MVWRDILGIIISVIVISGVFPENGEFDGQFSSITYLGRMMPILEQGSTFQMRVWIKEKFQIV